MSRDQMKNGRNGCFIQAAFLTFLFMLTTEQCGMMKEDWIKAKRAF